MNAIPRILGFTALCCLIAGTASAEVVQRGPTTIFKIPSSAAQASALDYANAKPLPLPGVAGAPKSQLDAMREYAPPAGEAGVSAGGGATLPSEPILPRKAQAAEDEDGGFTSQEFGTSNHPFSTARVDSNLRISNSKPHQISGKLYFKIGASTYWCSASLIKRGVIVTAAHCVANFGQSQFYSNWVFHPSTNEAKVPVDPRGFWTGASATVMTSYFNGTEVCYAYGVVCPNDVALVTLNMPSSNPSYPSYPGNYLGWNGYGWNGWGFNSSGQTLITQLGYPGGLDSGKQMQRNDSQGYKNTTFSNNTVIGSLMDGGSSGGPWINNFGIGPILGGISHGSYASLNIIVGVTSWGYVDQAIKEQGAAPFTSSNITVLVSAVCGATPAAC